MSMEVSRADLVSLATVDSKGRIVIHGQMREMAKIKEGDHLRLALTMAGDQWMISVVRPPKRDRSWSS